MKDSLSLSSLGRNRKATSTNRGNGPHQRVVAFVGAKLDLKNKEFRHRRGAQLNYGELGKGGGGGKGALGKGKDRGRYTLCSLSGVDNKKWVKKSKFIPKSGGAGKKSKKEQNS